MIGDLKEIYNDWINKSIKFNDHVEFIEIETPFVDMHHDFIHLVLFKDKNNFTISDDGHILNELDMLGVDVKSTESRQKYFMKKLRIFGVKHNPQSDELYISFDNLSEFPNKQHSLIQCMIHVSDMLQTARKNVLNIFTEDIKLFFDDNMIIYTPEPSFIGKSGNAQTFDFVIPHTKKVKEKLIKAINKPTSQNYKNAVFPFIEINEVRPDSDYYILANDSEEHISDKFISSVESWGVKVVPWSNKEKVINTFKVI